MPGSNVRCFAEGCDVELTDDSLLHILEAYGGRLIACPEDMSEARRILDPYETRKVTIRPYKKS